MRTCSIDVGLESVLRGRVEVAIFGRSWVGCGWTLEDRIVPEHYLTGYLQGSAAFAAGDTRTVLQPGSIAWVAPGLPHSIRPVSPHRGMRFFHLRFRLVGESGRELRFPQDLVVLPMAGPLLPHLEALHTEFTARLPHQEIRFRALLAAFLTEVLRLADAGEAPPLSLVQRQQVLAMAAARHPRALQPQELAHALGQSHDYFTRQFRKTFGVPPRTWLLRERLRAAATIVAASREPIATIAEQAGFASPYLFSRQFRQILGMTPRSWRRTQQALQQEPARTLRSGPGAAPD